MAWAHDARSYIRNTIIFLLGELRPRLGDGKRVGIIGTGATAVQTIQEIAKTVGHLSVFQRTPNWCAPLQNGKISDVEMHDIQARYEEIFALCRSSPGCYIHAPDPRSTLEVT